MGLWLSHISFKPAKQQAVAESILTGVAYPDAFVSPERNGWVTVREKSAAALTDPSRSEELAQVVCARCACHGLVLEVMDTHILCYQVFDVHGAVIAESHPENDSNEITDQEWRGLAGDLGPLAALATPPATIEQVRSILSRAEPLNMDKTLAKLAELVGLTDVLLTFDDFIDEPRLARGHLHVVNGQVYDL